MYQASIESAELLLRHFAECLLLHVQQSFGALREQNARLGPASQGESEVVSAEQEFERACLRAMIQRGITAEERVWLAGLMRLGSELERLNDTVQHLGQRLARGGSNIDLMKSPDLSGFAIIVHDALVGAIRSLVSGGPERVPPAVVWCERAIAEARWVETHGQSAADPWASTDQVVETLTVQRLLRRAGGLASTIARQARRSQQHGSGRARAETHPLSLAAGL